MAEVFVNPYSFVPFPERVERRLPTWHSGGPNEDSGRPLYCGEVTVRWRLVTPLLLPDRYAQEGCVDDQDRVRIAGSSVRGATRSLHETLFRGCLRVLDEDFVPSYRMNARLGTEPGWQLARVARAADGAATSVQLCDKVVWVDSTSLHARWPGRGTLPTSGDLIQLSGPATTSPLGRTEVHEVSNVQVVRRAEASDADAEELSLAPAGTQVLLVTSTQARHRTRQDRSRGRASWALGTLTDAVAPVSTRAQQGFRSACSGSDDRRRLDQAGVEGTRSTGWRTRTTFADVEWWGSDGRGFQVVARRARASGHLFVGDAVWAKVEAGQVVGIRLAQIWRKRNEQALSVGQRLGPRTATSLHPCAPTAIDEQLCLSCAVFGAADPYGDDRGKGEQTAYRGHVRFSSATSTAPVQHRAVDLTPMGSPNPGSGMFYLRMPDRLPPRAVGDVATQWGSEADTPPAPLAGRKYFWHSDPDRQATFWSQRSGQRVNPRYQAAPGQSASMRRRAHLVPAGTELTATITFDRLDEVGVRSLLASLDPSRILRLVPGAERRRFAVHLGGGKPLGLGSATITIESMHIESMTSRYLMQPPPAVDWQTVSKAEATMFAARVGRFTAALPAIGRLLDLDGLGEHANYVSYPPGASWNEVGSEEFRQSYGFFLAANGESLAGGVRHWHPLPAPTPGVEPTLPIRIRERRGRK